MSQFYTDSRSPVDAARVSNFFQEKLAETIRETASKISKGEFDTYAADPDDEAGKDNEEPAPAKAKRTNAEPVEPVAAIWFDEPAKLIAGRMWIRGFGPIPARIMVVGEKPAQIEVSTKRVFAGKAGAYLLNRMAFAGVKTDSCYFTNAVKYVIPGNKNATSRDIKTCKPMLEEEINRVRPALIVCLGSQALNAVAGKAYPISSVYGEIIDHPLLPSVKILPIKNPALVLRMPENAAAFDRELGILADYQAGKIAGNCKPPEIKLLKSSADIAAFAKDLFETAPAPLLSIDMEWEGATWMDPKRYIRTLQIGYAAGKCATVEFHDVGGTPVVDDQPAAWAAVKALLEDPRVSVIGHNVIADGEWLLSYGVDIRKRVVWDTMLAEFLLSETGPWGLDEVALKYTHYNRYSLSVDLWVKAHPELCRHGYGMVPRELLLPYGAIDVDAPRLIADKQAKLLAAGGFFAPRGVDGEYPSLWQTTLRTQELLYEVETTGMNVDLDRIEMLIEAYQKARMDLLGRITTEAAAIGFGDFSPSSPRDVGALLFQHLKLSPVKTTGGKAWADQVGNQGLDNDTEENASTDKTTLEILQDAHPIVKHILQFRRIDTACKTWLRHPAEGEDVASAGGGILSKIWEDGRLHPRFSQLAETGRFRTSKPNCFPGYVEVLTDRGWMRWDELYAAKDDGIKLAQWDKDSENREITFAHPLGWVTYDDAELLNIRTNLFVDVTTTPDHRIPLIHRRTGNKVEFTADALAAMNTANYRIAQAGILAKDGSPGKVKLTPAQVSLICAYQADGSDVNDGGIDWSFYKQRKIDRITAALHDCGIKFHVAVTDVVTNDKHVDRVRIYVGKHNIPDWLSGKKFFGKWLFDYDAETLAMFAEEVWLWDGCASRRSMYASKIKENTDWVQILALLAGRRCKTRKYASACGNDSWQTDVSDTPVSSMNRAVITDAGRASVYCCTTPKDTVIVRCNNFDGDKITFICNCQNLPKKAEGYMEDIFGKGNVPPNIRTIVVPTAGYVMMEADFCQAELFTLAALSSDENMIAALTTPGKDLHDMTACSAFGLTVLGPDGKALSEDDIVAAAMALGPASKEFKDLQKHFIYVDQKGNRIGREAFKSGLRVSAKTLNFGIPYGRGELAIAQQVKAETGSSKSIAELAAEVGQMITAWKTTTYPQAWKYLCECQQKVYNPGYIVNPWGRMRRFPGVKEKRADLERQAGNFNIQSTVADTAMIAMDLIDRYRLEHGLHFKIQNQIHDALMLEVPHAEIEECREMLKNTMGNIKIPVGGKLGTLVLGIDIDVYTRWGEKAKE